MINLRTFSEVLRRTTELSHMSGNCGRAYRRFLRHMCFGNDTKLLSVEFHGYGDKELSILEFGQLCAYVESVSKRAAVSLEEGAAGFKFSGLVRDKMYNVVGAVLELDANIDIETATVNELRSLVADVRHVVWLFFEYFHPATVERFVVANNIALSVKEEAALVRRVSGEFGIVPPRASKLLKYYDLPKRLTKALTRDVTTEVA